LAEPELCSAFNQPHGTFIPARMFWDREQKEVEQGPSDARNMSTQRHPCAMVFPASKFPETLQKPLLSGTASLPLAPWE